MGSGNYASLAPASMREAVTIPFALRHTNSPRVLMTRSAVNYTMRFEIEKAALMSGSFRGG